MDSDEDTISKEEDTLIDWSLMTDMEKVLNILDSISITPTIRYNLPMTDDLILETDLIHDVIDYYLNEFMIALEDSKAYLLNDYFMIKEFLDPLKVRLMAGDLDIRLKYFKKRMVYDLEEFEMLLNYASNMYDNSYNDLIGVNPNLILKVNLLDENKTSDFLALKSRIIQKVNSIFI